MLETAKKTVAELRKKGAQVVVMLAQTGGPAAEDLVAGVEGIDVAVLGRNVSLLDRGRRIGKTIVVYGGTQGHYECRTELTLDPARRVKDAETQAVMLGPEVTDSPAIAASVKAFEDALTLKTGKPAAAADTKEDGDK
jgi:2',3'-cyclic-nucleotide 2'-phosphodiesterase (5'-nucleotidase family)